MGAMISTLQVDRRPEIWKFEKKKNRARSDNTFDATTKNVLHQKQIFNSFKKSIQLCNKLPVCEYLKKIDWGTLNQNNPNKSFVIAGYDGFMIIQ